MYCLPCSLNCLPVSTTVCLSQLFALSCLLALNCLPFNYCSPAPQPTQSHVPPQVLRMANPDDVSISTASDALELRGPPRLELLWLNANLIDDVGAEKIGNCLVDSEELALTDLHLGSNMITDVGAKALFDVTIPVVRLDHNHVMQSFTLQELHARQVCSTVCCLSQLLFALNCLPVSTTVCLSRLFACLDCSPVSTVCLSQL